MTQIIVLVSRLRVGMGGVASYFRCLEGYLCSRARYVSIGGERTARGIVQRLKLLIGDYRRLRSELQGSDLQLVHLNPSMVWKAFFREAVHLSAARAEGKKVVVFWHGWDWVFAQGIQTGVRRLIFNRTYAHADCHIVLAERFRTHLLALGCRGPVVLESTVVADDTWGVPLRLPPRTGEPVRLLLLSRIVREKGVYVAIDAIAALRRAGHPVQLTIAGDGPERVPAEQYVAKHKLEGISFVGYVRGEQKQRLLAESDIYLFPSNHGEGMPLSVLEAMAAGLPVLGTRAGGLDDFFEDGVMGFSVDDPSAEVFVTLVEKLLSNPESIVQIGEHNRGYARKYFPAEVVAHRLFAIYDSVIEGAAANRAPVDWMKAIYATPGVEPCTAQNI